MLYARRDLPKIRIFPSVFRARVRVVGAYFSIFPKKKNVFPATGGPRSNGQATYAERRRGTETSKTTNARSVARRVRRRTMAVRARFTLGRARRDYRPRRCVGYWRAFRNDEHATVRRRIFLDGRQDAPGVENNNEPSAAARRPPDRWPLVVTIVRGKNRGWANQRFFFDSLSYANRKKKISRVKSNVCCFIFLTRLS